MSILAAMVAAVLASPVFADEECNRSPQHVEYQNSAGDTCIYSDTQRNEGVVSFASDFVDNFFNFTPDSSLTKANKALRMMSSRLRAQQESHLKLLAKQSSEQQITQILARTTPYKVETSPQGDMVSFQATRSRATLNTVFDRREFSIQILLKPVKPSKKFEWAFVIDDLQSREITQ